MPAPHRRRGLPGTNAQCCALRAMRASQPHGQTPPPARTPPSPAQCGSSSPRGWVPADAQRQFRLDCRLARGAGRWVCGGSEAEWGLHRQNVWALDLLSRSCSLAASACSWARKRPGPPAPPHQSHAAHLGVHRHHLAVAAAPEQQPQPRVSHHLGGGRSAAHLAQARRWDWHAKRPRASTAAAARLATWNGRESVPAHVRSGAKALGAMPARALPQLLLQRRVAAPQSWQRGRPPPGGCPS